MYADLTLNVPFDLGLRSFIVIQECKAKEPKSMGQLKISSCYNYLSLNFLLSSQRV